MPTLEALVTKASLFLWLCKKTLKTMAIAERSGEVELKMEEDYIEFECTSENTSVKIGYDDCLIVTISVQFEIPLNGGISTAELAEYLPDSGAWASASASPGWGYAGSDGDNVWFLGIKGQE